jgi:hypothetical protein
MTEERFKKLMSDFGCPDNTSLYVILNQVANEVAQEYTAKLDVAIQGLRDVVSPLGKFERELAPDERINGQYAYLMMQDPGHLKKTAHDALVKIGAND